MTRWQSIRLDMVLAVARLLGVPLRLRDAPEDEGAGLAAGRASGGGNARGGSGLFRKERRQMGRVVAFRKPGEPDEEPSIEDILRKA